MMTAILEQARTGIEFDYETEPEFVLARPQMIAAAQRASENGETTANGFLIDQIERHDAKFRREAVAPNTDTRN